MNKAMGWIAAGILGFFTAGDLAAVESSRTGIDPVERASRHPIVFNQPAVDFFEGALLGNGGLGVVVNTRPDAIEIRLAHNNVWDIRVAENHKDKIGTFQEIFDKVKKIPTTFKTLEEDPWFRDYMNLVRENYDKPYPRPFPCGTVVLGFERRRIELLGHRLDISTGLCEVSLLVDGKEARVQIFMDMDRDRVWIRLVDSQGHPLPSVFERVRLLPDPSTPSEFPRYTTAAREKSLSFRQILPGKEPSEYDRERGHPSDRAFRVTLRSGAPLRTGERVDWNGNRVPFDALERAVPPDSSAVLAVDLEEGPASKITETVPEGIVPTPEEWENARGQSRLRWEAYWSRSGVALSDEFLERIWYWNQYFLNCSLRPGVTCPGLFANWSYASIGTAWHGDYHMNYNTQQPFWGVFSSNHVEQHLPYADLVDRLLPLSRKWAAEYYGLRGAYFPHSAYPTEMSILPYPVPTWGWEICETPWTVQSLWWHYLYTLDEAFLRDRAFVPIRDAVQFLVDYMSRPDAHGPERWNDEFFHIFPTVPPELYGLRPGFQFNYDCLVDLTLTRFVFRAYLQSVEVLNLEEGEKQLAADVRRILERFPPYPTAETGEGTVFVSVPGESPEVVYNVPNSLMTVFPGEDHGLHSDPALLETLKRTYRNTRIEGGNELVFLNLQAARIGELDLDKFKRQIQYCLLPNGTCTDMVLQVHGRYGDTTAFDFMKKMGIWFENFALPAVVNECLLQSAAGPMRLFPNWTKDGYAEFRTLRAAGAFLVSAAFDGGQVKWVEIQSEKGARLSLINPWKDGARLHIGGEIKVITDSVIEVRTQPGDTLSLAPAEEEAR